MSQSEVTRDKAYLYILTCNVTLPIVALTFTCKKWSPDLLTSPLHTVATKLH